MKINKILIANRGEIACRIIQTCQKLGIETVAIYANIERNSRHVQLANEAFCIHSETPTSAYLDIQSIIDIAKKLVDFAKQHKQVKLKDAVLEGDSSLISVQDLSKMKSRIEILGDLAGLIWGPGRRIAGAIGSPQAKIAGCLKAIADK